VRRLIISTIVVLSAVVATVRGNSQVDRAPASLVGTWQVTVVPAPGPLSKSALTLSIVNGRLTGWLTDYDGDGSVACEFSKNTLKFSYEDEISNGSVQFRYSGTVQPDGTLAGSISRIQVWTDLEAHTRITSQKWTAKRISDGHFR